MKIFLLLTQRPFDGHVSVAKSQLFAMTVPKEGFLDLIDGLVNWRHAI